MKKTMIYTVLMLVSVFAATVYFAACKPDPCVTRDVDCRNGGTCKDGNCICASGYEGDSCQFRVNEKFDSYYACIRTRIINNTPPSEDADDTLRVKALNDRFTIQFFSIRDSVFEVINGTVDGNYITIPSQERNFGPYKALYSGNGSMNQGVITITLNKAWTNVTPFTTKTTYVGYKYE
jgi:hypothetical protein